MITAPTRDLRSKLHAEGVRAFTIKAWTGLGPIRSIRGGLLLMTIVAITPLMLFASGMALMRASAANQLPTAAAWVTVAAVPVLIGVSAVVVVSVASEAMVMEWLIYLERVSRAYARGRYSIRPQRLKQAPLEFRNLGAAVEDMAAAVEHRDQALRDALAEQTVLLREVHHRVKNNLQIIGSLLSLQGARAKNPAIKEALSDALVRIDAMSLVQRFMHQREDADTVSSVELFEGLAGQLRARMGGAGSGLVLNTDIEPRLLLLETGSRLAAIAAEAVICGFRGSHSKPLICRISVRFVADRVDLSLTAPYEPDAFAGSSELVSRDLIDGYTRQMKGTLFVDPGAGALAMSAPCPLPTSVRAEGSGQHDTKLFRDFDRTHGPLAS
jgi:hypothetical protein